MKVIALIPARSGSKRIPGKNIKLLGGKPLVVWSIECALALKLPCYVSTDSRVIADISRNNGAQVIQRPSELASDTATDAEVIKHAYSELDADLLVYLRPTTPMRDPQVVLNAIRFMQLNPGYTSLRSVEEMPESAFKCFSRRKNGLLDPLPVRIARWALRTFRILDYIPLVKKHLEELLTKHFDVTDWPNQKLPKTYHPNGYVDILRGVEWGLLKYGYETEPVTELDTPEQWSYAEWKISQRKHKT
jgi:N-acylneuraminate cytidylyltransferase